MSVSVPAEGGREAAAERFFLRVSLFNKNYANFNARINNVRPKKMEYF
jgi:hypothetical protein